MLSNGVIISYSSEIFIAKSKGSNGSNERPLFFINPNL